MRAACSASDRERPAGVPRPAHAEVALDQLRLPEDRGGLAEAGLVGEGDDRLDQLDRRLRAPQPLGQQAERVGAVDRDGAEPQLAGDRHGTGGVGLAVGLAPHAGLDLGEGHEGEGQGAELPGLLERPDRLVGPRERVAPAPAAEVELRPEGLGEADVGEAAGVARPPDPPLEVALAGLELPEPRSRREAQHDGLALRRERLHVVEVPLDLREQRPCLARPPLERQRAGQRADELGLVERQDVREGLLHAAQRVARPPGHRPREAGVAEHAGGLPGVLGPRAAGLAHEQREGRRRPGSRASSGSPTGGPPPGAAPRPGRRPRRAPPPPPHAGRRRPRTTSGRRPPGRRRPGRARPRTRRPARRGAPPRRTRCAPPPAPPRPRARPRPRAPGRPRPRRGARPAASRSRSGSSWAARARWVARRSAGGVSSSTTERSIGWRIVRTSSPSERKPAASAATRSPRSPPRSARAATTGPRAPSPLTAATVRARRAGSGRPSTRRR